MMDAGVSFIKDIYVKGLTADVIERNRSAFPSISIIVHKQGKFLQANEAVLTFEENFNSVEGFMFTTKNPFPEEEYLDNLEKFKTEFFDMAVFNTDSDIDTNDTAASQAHENADESALPKECVFYIYQNKVLVDRDSMGDVSINGGSYKITPKNENIERMHSSFWSRVMIREYPELAGKGYMTVPRGRVFYNKNSFHIFIDMEYFDNTGIRKDLETECRLSRGINCGYTIEYIKNNHYDYTRYL
jgi:hypothetical protein